MGMLDCGHGKGSEGIPLHCLVMLCHCFSAIVSSGLFAESGMRGKGVCGTMGDSELNSVGAVMGLGECLNTLISLFLVLTMS